MSEQRLPTRSSSRQPPMEAPENPNVVLSWLKELVRQAQLVWRLFVDRRVPWGLKSIPVLVLGYIILPVPPDIIPDFIFGLGQLDDLAVLLLGSKLFIELCPPEVVREHLRALGARLTEWPEGDSPTIEGEYSVEGPDELEAGEAESGGEEEGT